MNTQASLLGKIHFPEMSEEGLLQAAPFGYMWTAMNSKKIVASHTIYSVLEMVPFSELLDQKKWHEYVHPKDVYKLVQAEEELSANGNAVTVEYRLITRKGRHIFVNHYMKLSQSYGGGQRILSILKDITDQKRADIILEVMKESFFELDENLAFRRVNAKLEKFWNIPRNKLIGKKFLELFPQAVQTTFYKMISQSRINQAENTLDVICPITNHWVHLSLSAYSDGIVAIFYDIQNEKEAEQELLKQHNNLKEAEKEIKTLNSSLAVKNRQLQSANSEIKTFNSVAATDYSETLKHLYTNFEYVIINDGKNLSNAGRANIRRAQAAIQKMKLLTEDLTAYTRLQEMEGDKCMIDLNVILKAVMVDVEKNLQESGVELIIKEMPHIEGYPLLVSLVFHHLIENAIKFRKEDVKKPTILISCRESISGKETENDLLQSDAHYAVVSVTDNGIGFLKEESDNIFRIFYRLHEKHRYKGSGIGLAVCKKIMDIHGGLITTEVEPGKSAAFHCYFPIQM